jgi:hypothetical protein
VHDETPDPVWSMKTTHADILDTHINQLVSRVFPQAHKIARALPTPENHERLPPACGVKQMA